MRLSRQLLLLLVVLVVLLFVGTFAISVNNTRAYLESQLASHAQDAATSLGLSATMHAAQGDDAMVTTMVNAMFHRGDYLGIRIEDLDGRVLVERVTGVESDQVPAWFVTSLALNPPEREAIMMSGWRQVGRVLVRSHPGLAYQQLWHTATDTLQLYLVVAGAALLLGFLALRLMLRPLDDVVAQADAICNREFPVVRRRPFTQEFRSVVEAMNRLSARVAGMLEDAERLAAKLRSQAYQDPVTGLANRRSFMDVLAHRIAEPDLFARGGLVLVELNDFKRFNQQHGFAAGDRWLQQSARVLEAQLGGEAQATLARLAGAEFAILLEGADEARLKAFVDGVASAMSDLYGSLELPSPDVAHVGAAVYGGEEAAGLLALADQALRDAQRQGANAAVVRASVAATTGVRGSGACRKLVAEAMQGGRFRLLRQPVMACRDLRVLHEELFLRLDDPDHPGKDIPAAEFMPVVESHGLAATVDRAVLERVLTHMLGRQPHRLAVNLSTASLADGGLLAWLRDTLGRSPGSGAGLILEWPEYGAVAHLDRLAVWTDALRPLGVGFSLDHFGKGFASFAYLRSVKIDFLKVDGSFVRAIDEHEDDRFFLKTVADIAHGLDMLVVAESVESEQAWKRVGEIGVDAGRGYWLGVPAEG
jgi:diguanylate cyclase (GGDEF)-like protein